MTDPASLYEQRLTRLKTAIALGKPDKVPVIANADVFCAHHMGARMSRYSTSPWYANKIMVESFSRLPEYDGVEIPYAVPQVTAMAFMSTMKVAGRELPEGSEWQFDERERMTVADYDTIIKGGWPKYIAKYNKEQLHFTAWDLLKHVPTFIYGPKRFKKAGFPSFDTAFCQPPIETFASGRSMGKLMTDLHRTPDKLQEAMEVYSEWQLADVKKQIAQSKPLTVFIFNARGSSQFISPKLWERFTWPYLKKLAQTIIEAGSVPNLHCDSNWDRVIERFKELPKGKCVFACDSSTDIFKAKKALDGHMCIKGDVPASLLTMGTPEDVHAYCTRLVREVGPSGFILSPGCTLPMKAKLENVKAMLASVQG